MKRVVQIHRKSFVGQFSIERLFAALRREMGRQGWQPHVHIVPFRSKGVIRRLINSLSAYVRNADVYHVTGDIHYVAIFLPSNKTILTVHDCGALDRMTGFKRWLLKLFWFDFPVRRVKYVTVISEETKRQLLRHVNVRENKIQVIPNSISPVYRPCPRPFHSECPRILHIGTKENKNLSRLISALRDLQCHLHIVGHLSESQIQQLRAAKIDFSNSVDLTDEEVFECYCQADLVAFVSTYEGFGLPILEANAVGRAVVTSNVSSLPEVAGDAACLVDPYDVVSIRQGLVRVIHDIEYREQLITSGYRNWDRFSLAVVAQSYLALYDRVIAASANPY